MIIQTHNDSFLSSIANPEEISVSAGLGTSSEFVAVGSCSGTAGTFGSWGTACGCLGTFGTAGSYGCGE